VFAVDGGDRVLKTSIRINMTGRNQSPSEEAERYRGAIELARLADAKGFHTIILEEHHCAENGWLSSPLTLASMILATTARIRVKICALLVTLYDPVRLAEDIAVIDAIAKGRLDIVAGQGYRPLEYHALDKTFEDRGRGMDHVLDTLLKAWTGEPFDYRGRRVRVSPTPVSRPNLMIGGMSRNGARRAARFGLPFSPAAKLPELEALYLEELERNGQTGLVDSPAANTTFLFIDEDPDRAWRELGDHFLAETVEYASWEAEKVDRPFETEAQSAETIRDQGVYEIITPAECRSRIKRDGEYAPMLHPLVGGIPLARARRCLELFAEQVLERL